MTALPRDEISLPDDLPEDVKRELLALARESKPQPAHFPIDELFIRHWCETLEDGNPLYLDEEFARSRGLRGLMAPPVLVFPATAFPFRWPWPPKGGFTPLILAEAKRLLDLPVGIATESELEFILPLQVGDRVSTSSRLLSISPWKKTRLGEGHFIRWAHSYWNECGEKVAEQRVTLFAYGRGLGGDAGLALRGGYSNAVEEAIEGAATPYQPKASAELFWEDVNEGDELPSIRMPINMTRCVFMASATRDFSPQHSNPEYAKQRSGARDVFVNTQFNMGMASRLATDWAGPSATVRRVKIAMRENVCAGDDMIVTGRVIRKYAYENEHRVDIDVMISTQERPATPCEVTVALPSRRGG
jgi:acyl dehydratase